MQIPTYDNKTIDIQMPESKLIALPALIDPHVHFRIPGGKQKEDWKTAGAATIAGGVTTVFDMPNNNPPTIDELMLEYKKRVIKELLEVSQIPINYKLWLGATAHNLDEIEKLKDKIVGVKIFMGSSTGNLLVENKEDQRRIFELAAKLNLIVAVHAEDEDIIKDRMTKIGGLMGINVEYHSLIRPREAAIKAVSQAIELAEMHGTKLYILHVSTKEELEIIRLAKQRGVKVFAEVTPHHLFLTEDSYKTLGTRAQMNPPLRTEEDRRALWEGIQKGIIDTIGTDHAPHRLEEKAIPYPGSPSGVPGIETVLPLLLTEYQKGNISLEKIVQLTKKNIEKIFGLEPNNDWVIVDLNMEKEVRDEDLKTKCGWSPFNGWKLKGWPVAVILKDKIYYL